VRLIFIPDTQVRKGVPTDHLFAAGNYCVAHKPDVIVFAGDHWDMPSLSKYSSNLEIEGKRIIEDIDSGKAAMDLFLMPMVNYNLNASRNKKKQYKPRLVYLIGNHDCPVRIPRLVQEHPILSGVICDDTKEFLEDRGFEVYDFLEVVDIEGIRFSHYFTNPHSAKKMPLSGAMDTMLKNAGFSFVAGHTQGLKMAKHFLSDGTARLGISAGSFYQHNEDYMGTQGNFHWRGIIMLNEVKNGSADICEVSLNFLLKNYGDASERRR
jgi:hypothetical protein